MKKSPILVVIILMAVSLACSASVQGLPPASPSATSVSVTNTPASTNTASPLPATPTPLPTYTPVPETVVLDFAKELCNAQWMNGGQEFVSCPDAISDHSTGYAALIDPISELFPQGTPILLTVPAWNGYAALFLRYPSVTIRARDHFMATLQCRFYATICDVEFGLDYYDSNGQYHSPLAIWKYRKGDVPINVDYDLSMLAGQNVDIVLALRPNIDTPGQETALWINPKIYRPNP